MKPMMNNRRLHTVNTLYAALRTYWWLPAMLLLALSVYNSILLTEQYPNDLRNRIVGARLQAASVSPYFYHWMPGDSPAYFDASNYALLKVSNMTASPFYHWIIGPVSQLGQYQAAYFFLWLNYALLIVITALHWRLASQHPHRWVIPVVAVLFTLGSSWQMQMQYGQLYFQLGFLMALSSLLLYTSGKPVWHVMAGFGLAAAILIKPTVVLLAVALMFKNARNKPFVAGLLLPLAITVVSMMASPFQQQLWKDYLLAIQEHSRFHMQPAPTGGEAPFAQHDILEGFSKEKVAEAKRTYPYRSMGEQTNLSYWLEKAGIKPVTANMLHGITLTVLICIGMVGLLVRKRLHLFHWLLAGWFCVLMLDYSSPVLRGGYVGVLWLLPLLLVVATCSHLHAATYLLLLAGLALQVADVQWIPMRQTLSEGFFGLVLITVLVQALATKPQPALSSGTA